MATRGFSFTQVGYGNTAQAGLLNVAAANGSANNILSAGSGNIVGSTGPARTAGLLRRREGIAQQGQEGAGPGRTPSGRPSHRPARPAAAPRCPDVPW